MKKGIESLGDTVTDGLGKAYDIGVRYGACEERVRVVRLIEKLVAEAEGTGLLVGKDLVMAVVADEIQEKP